jgi:hypothetical protein
MLIEVQCSRRLAFSGVKSSLACIHYANYFVLIFVGTLCCLSQLYELAASGVRERAKLRQEVNEVQTELQGTRRQLHTFMASLMQLKNSMASAGEGDLEHALELLQSSSYSASLNGEPVLSWRWSECRGAQHAWGGTIGRLCCLVGMVLARAGWMLVDVVQSLQLLVTNADQLACHLVAIVAGMTSPAWQTLCQHCHQP